MHAFPCMYFLACILYTSPVSGHTVRLTSEGDIADMLALWNRAASLWRPSGLIRFEVGPADAKLVSVELEDSSCDDLMAIDPFAIDATFERKSFTFIVPKDILVELSPVVKAAVTGEFKEGVQQLVKLPQFDANDFELFVRLAQTVAFCSPPDIGAPSISDSLILRVVPIAAYLDVEKMIKMMEAHVQQNPTLATVLIFETTNVPVQWGEKALNKLFTELTDELYKATDLYRQGAFSSKVNNCVCGPNVPGKMYKLKGDAQDHLGKLSIPTTHTFIKFLLENRCMTVDVGRT